MLDGPAPHTNDPDTTPGSDVARSVVIDQVVAELAVSGMRMDGFVALATEGLLPDENLRELWRRHRDVLVPDWAA